MGFWDQATDQAGREFGARHWRWFTAARVARKLAPAIAVVLIAGALLLAYRLVAPDWSAIGDSAGGVAPAVVRWALIGLVGVGAVALLIRAGIAVWQANSLRWRLSRFSRSRY